MKKSPGKAEKQIYASKVKISSKRTNELEHPVLFFLAQTNMALTQSQKNRLWALLRTTFMYKEMLSLFLSKVRGKKCL